MGLHKLDTQMYVGQKAFINKKGKLLVLRDADDKGLDFPGGKYRWGGDLKDELAREVTEETGLKIKIGRPFVTWTAIKIKKINVFLIGYLCEYVSGDVVLSDEHDDFEWVDKNTFNKWEEDSHYYEALKEYFRIKL